MQRNYGAIHVTLGDLQNNPRFIKVILSHMAIYRAEALDSNAKVVYYGDCELFDPIEVGGVVPVYVTKLYSGPNKSMRVEFIREGQTVGKSTDWVSMVTVPYNHPTVEGVPPAADIVPPVTESGAESVTEPVTVMAKDKEEHYTIPDPPIAPVPPDKRKLAPT